MQQLAALAPFLPPGFTARAWDWFSIPVTATIATLVTGIASGTLDRDSDFLVTDITGVCTTTASPPVFTDRLIVPALVSFSDSSTSASWMTTGNSGPWSGYIGSNENPYRLVMPRIIRGGTTIQATIQNLSAATQVFRININGIRVYNFRRDTGN